MKSIIRQSLLCLFLPCAAVSYAQTSEADYFSGALAGKVVSADFADRKLDVGEVESTRKSLWDKWVKAVKAMPLPSLIATEPLDSARNGSIALPDSLEPHAVMPYYWGTKGEISATGHTSIPTFVYLHGSGPKQIEWANGLQLALRFADAPCHYFIPQIPNEGSYYRWWQRAKQWAYRWLWLQLMTEPTVDPDRIYLFGISEGGYGSQRLASFYADYLAAAGPMAGGEPLQNAPAENLGQIGFSFLTGSEDFMFCRNIYTRLTQSALDSLEKVYPGEYAHRVELIEGRGHGIDYTLTTPWLLQFERNPWPRHFVWEDYEMDGLHREGFYNLKVDERPSDSLRTRYDVNIGGDGQIDIQVRNVEYIPVEKEDRWGFTLKWHKAFTAAEGGRFTLFLDEHLVDLNGKATVTVNGKVVFKGKLKPNYRAMVESLATFGDPQRIYPVALEVVY
ncbi:MAG: hypothetical protein Q4E59_07190 [Bacteroidales bacterium]|nr:hypothetical protein [Bacteroidales bacterium]